MTYGDAVTVVRTVVVLVGLGHVCACCSIISVIAIDVVDADNVDCVDDEATGDSRKEDVLVVLGVFVSDEAAGSET